MYFYEQDTAYGFSHVSLRKQNVQNVWQVLGILDVSAIYDKNGDGYRVQGILKVLSCVLHTHTRA